MSANLDSRRLLEGLGLSPDEVSDDVLAKLMELATANAKLTARMGLLEMRLKRAELLADNDPLCPLFNRRAFMRELAREIDLAGRHETHLSVLYIDLDQFKRVNDTLGHEVGDEVLVTIARLLKENVRRTDIVGRIGGDEFAVVLIRSNPTQTAMRVNALREMLQHSDVQLHGVKASIGAVKWRDGMSASDIMQAADRAMFANKTGLKDA